jgi:hypothetical protein
VVILEGRFLLKWGAPALGVACGLGCSVHEHSTVDTGAVTSCQPTTTGATSQPQAVPTSTPGAGVAHATDAASCSVKTGGSLCTSVPKFAGAQVLDAIADEFCDVPATVFELRRGVTFFHQPPPTVPDVMTARIAWDNDGIHAHFHVDDPLLVRDFRYSSAAGPDYVELDIGGAAPLSGYYDGETYDVGLMNVFLSPESTLTPIKGFTGPVPAQAAMGFYSQQHAVERNPLTDTAKWAYRTVSGGYEFELFLRWNLLGRSSPPASGTAIALDLGFGTQNNPNYWAWWPSVEETGSAMYAGQTFLAVNSPGATTTCVSSTADNANPWCDDRTWCHPTLE